METAERPEILRSTDSLTLEATLRAPAPNQGFYTTSMRAQTKAERRELPPVKL
jgi:hypothetical protein